MSMQFSNAGEACASKEKKRNAAGDVMESIMGMTPMGAIGKLFGSMKSKNKSETQIRNILENKVDASTKVKMDQKCEADINVTQSNFVDNSECLKNMGCDQIAASVTEMAKVSESLAENYLEKQTSMCAAFSDPTAKTTQKNSLNAQQNCVIDSAMDLLTKMDMDDEVMAAVEKLQEAKGLFTENDSKSNMCNVVKKDIDASKFMSAYQSCLNKLKLNQSNYLKCVVNADQSNVVELMLDCMIGMKVTDVIDIKTKTKTAATLKETMKAEGLTPMMCAMSFGGCCIVIVVIYGLFSFMKGKGGAAKR